MDDPLDAVCRLPPLPETQIAPINNSRITFSLLRFDTPNQGPLDFSVKYVDPKIYGDYLQGLKVLNGLRDLERWKGYVYPYENLSRCGYTNRCGVKLANIDYHFNLLPTRTVSDDFFPFVDLAGGPGGFSEYILSRYPKGMGVGITLKRAIEWNPRLLSDNRFCPFYGPDRTGDLLKWYREFRQDAIRRQPDLYPLIVADAGFEETDREAKEGKLYTLLLIEAFLGTALTRVGGSFVVKVYDLTSRASASILWFLTHHFRTISIFKPITSRTTNVEAYIILQGRNDWNGDLDRVDAIIQNHLRQPEIGLVYDVIPPEFEAYLHRRNNDKYNLLNSLVPTMVQLQQTGGKHQDSNVYRIDDHRFLLTLHLKTS